MIGPGRKNNGYAGRTPSDHSRRLSSTRPATGARAADLNDTRRKPQGPTAS
ncbi:hypothetical protein ABZ927_39010 [Streptomyces massasporeus]